MLVEKAIHGDIATLGGVVNSFGGNMSMPSIDYVRMHRPYLDSRGRACVTIRDLEGRYTVNDSTGGEKKPLTRGYLMVDLINRGYPLPLSVNAATLTKEQWAYMDQRILPAFRQELSAAQDLENAASFGGFDGLSKMTFEYQVMSEAGEAFVDMDLQTDGRRDAPLTKLRSLPLPCTHSDFGFSQREEMVSAGRGTSFSMVMGEQAARRVAESIEDQTIGLVTGVTYGTQTAGHPAYIHDGTSTVYGYLNAPQRLTKTNFTAPTAGGWVANTTYNEILTALQQLSDQFHNGPFMLYHSTDWTPYMSQVFSISGGNSPGETLRTMLMKLPQIQNIKQLDRLTPASGNAFTFIFAQMRSGTAEMINGRDITTIQWTEKGGLALRFKVYAIKVPLLRWDYYNRTGILHGTTS